jgi:hypothetical protein
MPKFPAAWPALIVPELLMPPANAPASMVMPLPADEMLPELLMPPETFAAMTMPS